MATQQIYTDVIINKTIAFNSDSSLKTLSIYATSGSCTIQGNLQVPCSVNGAAISSRPSLAVTLAEGQSVTVGVDTALPIDNLTIITAGTVSLLGRS